MFSLSVTHETIGTGPEDTTVIDTRKCMVGLERDRVRLLKEGHK